MLSILLNYSYSTAEVANTGYFRKLQICVSKFLAFA